MKNKSKIRIVLLALFISAATGSFAQQKEKTDGQGRAQQLACLLYYKAQIAKAIS
jgi:hypothetical protein